MKRKNSTAIVLIALALLMVFAGCAGGPKQESTGQYVDDSTITAKVKAAYVGDPDLKSTQISVETYKGVVQLSGFVNKQEDVTRAADLARRVDGVRDVKNNLIVKKQ